MSEEQSHLTQDAPGQSGAPPPGLKYLEQIDQLLVQRQVELSEGSATSNKYVVRNSSGQQLYFAAEDTSGNSCCTSLCCCCLKKRHLDMKIFDNEQKEVIQLIQNVKCFLQKMEVQAPAGSNIGYVSETWNPCFPKFAIQDAGGDTMVRIKGPLCSCICCCCDVAFDIMSENGSARLGKITKQGENNTFSIRFPVDLSVCVKATLLGAFFLLDFLEYFGKSATGKNKGGYTKVKN